MVAALLLLLLTAQQLLSVPGDSVIRLTLHNTLHVPWFFLITLLLHRLLGSWRQAIPVALLIALGSEGVQLLTDREADLLDLTRNLLGGVLAWCWHTGFSKNRAGNAAGESSGLERIARPLFVALLCLAAGPLLWNMTAWASLHHKFPELLNSESAFSIALVRTETTVDHNHRTRLGLQLTVDDKPWPGIHLTDPVGNWQGYTSLVCDCSVDPGPPLDVFVGLLLKPGDGLTNFAIATVTENRRNVRWDIQDLSHEGDQIHDVFVYTTGEYAGRKLNIHRIWLE